jgi:hypothetical protein
MKKKLISVLCLLVAALTVLAFPTHGQKHRRSAGRPGTPAKARSPKEHITTALPDPGSVKEGVFQCQ